jgi:hypothetical protein
VCDGDDLQDLVPNAVDEKVGVVRHDDAASPIEVAGTGFGEGGYEIQRLLDARAEALGRGTPSFQVPLDGRHELLFGRRMIFSRAGHR